MMRFFSPNPFFKSSSPASNNAPVNSSSQSSLFSTLSSAIGWLNPFNVSRAEMNKMLYGSLVLMQTIPASAASCFRDSYSNYSLSCMPEWIQWNFKMALIKNECGVTFINCTEHSYLFNWSRIVYEPEWNCTLLYDAYSPCVYSTFDYPPDLTVPILKAVGGTLGVLGALALSGYGGYRGYQLIQGYYRHDNQAIIEATPLKNPLEKKYNKLINALNDSYSQQKKFLIDLENFKDEFKCPITLELMQFPVTLGCGHSGELACMANVYTCPLCRQKFDPDTLSINKEMQKTISKKLQEFKKQIKAIPHDENLQSAQTLKNNVDSYPEEAGGSNARKVKQLSDRVELKSVLVTEKYDNTGEEEADVADKVERKKEEEQEEKQEYEHRRCGM
jgi:U-box domain